MRLTTSQLQMVEAGRARLHQREQMMVAAVDTVHEGDEIGGAVRQARARRCARRLDRLDTSRVKMRTCDRRRGCTGGACALAAPGLPADRHPLAFGLPVGRHFRPDLDLDEHAFVVTEPEAVALETGRGIDQLDALILDARLQARQVMA